MSLYIKNLLWVKLSALLISHLRDVVDDRNDDPSSICRNFRQNGFQPARTRLEGKTNHENFGSMDTLARDNSETSWGNITKMRKKLCNTDKIICWQNCFSIKGSFTRPAKSTKVSYKPPQCGAAKIRIIPNFAAPHCGDAWFCRTCKSALSGVQTRSKTSAFSATVL